MNLPFHILNFLKTNRKTEISGFGTFSLKNSGATISSEQSILPPAKEIVFVADYENRDRTFIQHISQQENLGEFDVELELKKHTNQWKNKLEANQEFEIETIGTFRNIENELHFKGKRIDELAPDFYGLEEIKIPEIKNKVSQKENRKTASETENSYKFNKSILWIFLVAIPVAGILYFGIANPELLFGKKSNLYTTNSTHRIEPKKQINDSLKQAAIQDSLKKDSLKIKTVQK